jgi:hypothetical protein
LESALKRQYRNHFYSKNTYKYEVQIKFKLLNFTGEQIQQPMKAPEISYVAIYPPIGIARIGNSPEHFLATDQPGISKVPHGGFKDSQGRIKKEVARFRVYAFTQSGKVLRELTANEATIEWRAEVANVKPAWYEFNNAMDLGKKYAIPSIHRNKEVKGG